MPVATRPPRADEFAGWSTLFREYRNFYRLEPDEAVVLRVWSWIHDPQHETSALVAVASDGALVGLAHYRRFARPSTGTQGIYLDDLVTDPSRRGLGVGRALVAAVTDIAAKEGDSVVRWMTAHDNVTAQRLYDAIAARTSWVTYDRPCP
jgi:ribosomal protein S18 acetylase RimI-like enzyme